MLTTPDSLFEPQKAIEIVLYLAMRIQNPTQLVICRLIYFADKTCIEKHGKMVSDDIYCALRKGPVPSRIYNLIKEDPGTIGGAFISKGMTIFPQRDANQEWLSTIDIECLDLIIAQYGSKPVWIIGDDSRDRVWKAAWSKRKKSDCVPICLESIVSEFDNAEKILRFLKMQYDY